MKDLKSGIVKITENKPLRQLDTGVTVLTEVPMPPDDLGEHGSDMWKLVAAELHNTGKLSVAALPQLSRYCKMHEVFVSSWERTNKGADIASYGGFGAHPSFRLMERAQRAMETFEKNFGLNPKSFSRTPAFSKNAKINNGSNDEYDEFDEV